MSNQRTTFAKRQREQNRKDKARAKQERLAARRASGGAEKGPPIAWGEAVHADTTDDGVDSSPTPPSPTTSDISTDG